jgi:hypothetical protein
LISLDDTGFRSGYDGPLLALQELPMRSILFALLALFAVAAPAAAQDTAVDARAALYELRVYHAQPGKLDALNARFREHTLELFEKHGMRNVAYWIEPPTPESPDGKVIYVLAFPGREAREASWQAFGADPVWQEVHATSEAGGKLIARIDSTLMSLADYSPLITLADEPE